LVLCGYKNVHLNHKRRHQFRLHCVRDLQIQPGPWSGWPPSDPSLPTERNGAKSGAHRAKKSPERREWSGEPASFTQNDGAGSRRSEVTEIGWNSERLYFMAPAIRCNALFESLDLDTSFLVCTTSIGEVRVSRSLDQSQGHRNRRSYKRN